MEQEKDYHCVDVFLSAVHASAIFYGMRNGENYRRMHKIRGKSYVRLVRFLEYYGAEFSIWHCILGWTSQLPPFFRRKVE